MNQIGITQLAFTKLTGKDDYGTPDKVVKRIETNYIHDKFRIDACASYYNAKCDYYITKEMNLFTHQLDETTFMNPIYAKKGYRTFNKGTKNEFVIYNEYGTADFVEYANKQHFKHNSTIAVLLFSNVSSSDYYQKFVGETPDDKIANDCAVFDYPRRIRFDKFENGVRVPDGTPAMSSIVVIFDERFGK